MELWLVDLAASADALEAAERSAPRIPDTEMRRLGAISDKDHRRARLLSHAALRLVVARWCGSCGADRQPFDRSATGRPMLPGSGIDFSLSHAGSLALIAVAPAGGCAAMRVGADIEVMRSIAMPDHRRRRLVAAARLLVDACDGAQTAAEQFDVADADVLRAWVRVEAFTKAIGSGAFRVLTALGVIGAGAGADAVRVALSADERQSDGLGARAGAAAGADGKARGATDATGFAAPGRSASGDAGMAHAAVAPAVAPEDHVLTALAAIARSGAGGPEADRCAAQVLQSAGIAVHDLALPLRMEGGALASFAVCGASMSGAVPQVRLFPASLRELQCVLVRT